VSDPPVGSTDVRLHDRRDLSHAEYRRPGDSYQGGWRHRSPTLPPAEPDIGDIVRVVGDTGPSVEPALRAGRLTCPRCDGPLRPWGRARLRVIRIDARVRRAVHPRRARCSVCRATHVLLPDWLLVRRAYAAPVIWTALTAQASGMGYRRIALRMRVPETTVRDWLRAFRRAEPGLCDRLAEPGTAPASAVRLLERLCAPLPPWRFAVRVTAGRLLHNTSPPHAAGSGPSAHPP